jgi:hypothetical protein
MHIKPLITAILLSIARISVASDQVFVVTHNVSSPSVNGNNTQISLPASSLVHIIKRQKSQLLVEALDVADATKGNLWISENHLSNISSFKPVDHWQGNNSIDVEAGDYGGKYKFRRNGTFVLKQLENVNDNFYKEKIYAGRLYRSGNVIWAKLDKFKGNSIEFESTYLFCIESNGHLSHLLVNGCISP